MQINDRGPIIKQLEKALKHHLDQPSIPRLGTFEIGKIKYCLSCNF